MKTQDAPVRISLRAALRGLSSELDREMPPAALQQRVLDALGEPARRRTAVHSGKHPATAGPAGWRRVLHGLATWGSATAVATFAAAFVMGAFWLPAREPHAAALATAFVPVVPAERLVQLAQRPLDAGLPWVVTAEMPRERLAAFGLPFDPARAGEPVRAELLLHPAGDVLAVRIVR